MPERVSPLPIAAQQLRNAEFMSLGLKDGIPVDGPDLTDMTVGRADEAVSVTLDRSCTVA